MAKTKIAPAPPKEQAPRAAQAIPLSDVTITCYRQPHFGEEGDQPIAIPGKQLGQVLAWLLQTRPGIVGQEDADLWSASDIATDLEGLGEILIGLSMTDLDNIPADVPSVFSLLADVTSDLAARLSASEDGDQALTRATFALPARKEAAA